MAQHSLVGQSLLLIKASWSHWNTPHSVQLLQTSEQSYTEISTWQHTTLTRDRHPCLPVGFKPAIPASEQLHTHALDHVATGNGPHSSYAAVIWQMVKHDQKYTGSYHTKKSHYSKTQTNYLDERLHIKIIQNVSIETSWPPSQEKILPQTFWRVSELIVWMP